MTDVSQGPLCKISFSDAGDGNVVVAFSTAPKVDPNYVFSGLIYAVALFLNNFMEEDDPQVLMEKFSERLIEELIKQESTTELSSGLSLVH